MVFVLEGMFFYCIESYETANPIIKGNEYKLLQPSMNPSGKYTKY